MMRESEPERETMRALCDYIEDRHRLEGSSSGLRQRAMHGDIDAVRALLGEAREALNGARLSSHSADDADLAFLLGRILGRMLDQPDAALRTALGLNRQRKTGEHLLRDRVLYFAVDHCRFGMGKVRALEDACALVHQATEELPAIFPVPLTEENISKVYERAGISDPLGPGVMDIRTTARSPEVS